LSGVLPIFSITSASLLCDNIWNMYCCQRSHLYPIKHAPDSGNKEHRGIFSWLKVEIEGKVILYIYQNSGTTLLLAKPNFHLTGSYICRFIQVKPNETGGHMALVWSRNIDGANRQQCPLIISF
jgi:hypothetical protein